MRASLRPALALPALLLSAACTSGETAAPDAGPADSGVAADAGTTTPDAGDGADAGPGADAGRDDAGTPLTVETFCPAYYDRMCAWNGACRNPGRTDCNFPYAADLLRSCVGFAKRAAAGAMRFDPEAAEACLAQDFELCGSPRPFESEACLAAFVGQVPVAGDCYVINNRPFDRECTPDAYCDNLACPGVCAAYGTEGQACANGNPPCDSATYCSEDVCRPRPQEGESCGQAPCLSPLGCYDQVCRLGRGIGEACAADAPCTFTLICADGTCTNHVGSGEPCGRAEHCPTGELCIGNATVGRTCQAPLAVDAPCDPAIEGGVCGLEGLCRDVSTTSTPEFRCRAAGRDGESCDPLGCANGFWCRYGGAGDDVNGTCRPLGGPQDSCASARAYDGETRCIQSLYCIEDLCAPPSAAGGPCNYSGTCEAGLWCSGARCVDPAGPDEACDAGWADTCVADHFCDGGTLRCAPKRPLGALCDSGEVCLSGSCGEDENGILRCVPAPVPCVRP